MVVAARLDDIAHILIIEAHQTDLVGNLNIAKRGVMQDLIATTWS